MEEEDNGFYLDKVRRKGQWHFMVFCIFFKSYYSDMAYDIVFYFFVFFFVKIHARLLLLTNGKMTESLNPENVSN